VTGESSRQRRSGRRTARAVSLAIVTLMVMVGGSLWAQNLPRPVGYVNDFANIIPADDEQQIQRIITAVQKQTGAEIAVVTVQSMSPYATIEDFGIALADDWGVGSAADDAGIILIVALAERMFRIEVGYGLEGAIPDGKAGAIRDDYVLPDLREGDYGAGLLKGVGAIALEIAEEYGVTLSDVEIAAQPVGGNERFDLGNLFYLIFVLIAFGGRFFFWPLLFAGRRRGIYGGGFGAGMSHRSGNSGFSGGGGFGGGGFGGGGASGGF
jgi:uncharacterized protein